MAIFGAPSLYDVLNRKMQEAKAYVDSLSNDIIMGNDIATLRNNVLDKYRIAPLNIEDEDPSLRKIIQVKRQVPSPMYQIMGIGDLYISVDYIDITYSYPYTGDEIALRHRPSTYTLSEFNTISIVNRTIACTVSYPLSDIQGEQGKQKADKQINHDMGIVRSNISNSNREIDSYNTNLSVNVTKSIKDKREKVESFYSLAKIFEIPLEKSNYAKNNIPLERKIIPLATSYKNEPIWKIKDEEYDFILDTIRHNASTYERTPSAFSSLSEESLRDILLGSLNGMYKGSANGEAFRKKGKTDICIENENRAAFVAECKIWKGQSLVKDALKQLDGYLTWRDCKTALIYFVKNKDFFSVIETAVCTLKAEASYRQMKEVSKNEYEFIFMSISNLGQLIKVRVFLFNLYSNKQIE